jgi:hypothetical protein
MTLNLAGRIRTRNGYPVDLYRINVRDRSPFTIHGAFYEPRADRWYVCAWTADGELTPGEQSELDLINSPPTPTAVAPAHCPSSAQAPVVSAPPPALSLSEEAGAWDVGRAQVLGRYGV